MEQFLSTSISYLKTVGPARADVLVQELGIRTFGDLLQYYPFRYIDKSKFFQVNQLHDDIGYVQIIGTLQSVETVGFKRSTRLVAKVADSTGVLELVWFKGIKWVKPNLHIGKKYVVFGKPTSFNRKMNIAHPEIELYTPKIKEEAKGFQPVYHTTEKASNKGLNSKGIEKLTTILLSEMKGELEETLSTQVRSELRLISKTEATRQIHFPNSAEDYQKASMRLKFEELFFVQLGLLKMKVNHKTKIKGFLFNTVGENFNQFYSEHLPFELTNAQKRVVKEIRVDMGSGAQMNRLLQGDVGSGKTIVALLVMLISIDNGFQAAIMAPTEILATQHYEGIAELLEGMDVKIALLTGSTKTARRKEIHADLLSGELNILIGTHALLEEIVQFKKLGLVVVDEQHRFGVAQRARLWKKGDGGVPHVLVMTATPIPRTLAMTFYGDLDTSVIDELPPGRKPIKTIHKFDNARNAIWGFIKDEIAKGRQAYIVYPLIQESEKMDYKDLMDGYESVCRDFPECQISIVHGQMKPADKEFEMQRFLHHKTQIMVATTVIEVGVNVPNASIMVIESAERFGLSQLHQLRGRVGRGAEQSYCIMVTGYKLSNDGKTRMQTMEETNDGFKISEVDLKLRGPGNLMGTQQSGILDLKIADISKDSKILFLAREIAKNLLENDPNLEATENLPIRKAYIAKQKNNMNWSRIS